MPGRRIALLLNNPYVADSRAWKIATGLAGRGEAVTVVALAAPGLPERERAGGVEVVRIPDPTPRWWPAPRLPSSPEVASRRDGPGRRVAETAGRRVAATAGRLVTETVGRLAQAGRFLVLARRRADWIARVVGPVDIWQAEGLVALPIALELRRRLGGRVVYDARDLVASAGFARLPGPWLGALLRRERAWARAADAVVTVNEPLARELEARIGRPPAVVANGPLRIAGPDDAAHERRFHERLGLPSEARVVLFLGQIAPERGLEQLCEAIGAVERAVLVLAGPGPDRARLERFAARLPWADRIRFLGPIPPPEIPAWTAAADVAAVLARPTTLNHRLATPTKLFDALGAGVPVVAANLPGIASIVGPSGCGILCDPGDPADIARAIRAILDAPPERRASFRAAALATAEAFAWERQLDRLLAVYDGLDIRPGGTVAAPQPTVGARAGRHAVERAGRPSEADAETRPPNGR